MINKSYPARLLIFCAALALAEILASPVSAQDSLPEAGWQAKPELTLTGVAHFRRQEGISTGHDTAALTAELTFHSDARPYYGGFVVDYRASTTSRHDDNLNLGVYFRYNFPRWDSTTWLFVNQAPRSPDTWMYATRLRYQVTDRTKFGIEALAPTRNSGALQLMLGYYGMLGRKLSMNVLAGRASDGEPDLIAKVELVWQVR